MREEREPGGRRPWYREPFVWMLIAIPGWAVISGFVTLYLASASFDGLVADDYYKQGLEINRSLARDRAATARGLDATLRLDRAAGQVRTNLQASSAPRMPERLRLGLYHATRAGFDREVALERTGARAYAAALPELVPGRWYLELGTAEWRLTGSLRMPGEGVVRLQSRAAATR